jgi:hypothetical protein
MLRISGKGVDQPHLAVGSQLPKLILGGDERERHGWRRVSSRKCYLLVAVVLFVEKPGSNRGFQPSQAGALPHGNTPVFFTSGNCVNFQLLTFGISLAVVGYAYLSILGQEGILFLPTEGRHA